jgi:Ca2+/Na+ antiporter
VEYVWNHEQLVRKFNGSDRIGKKRRSSVLEVLDAANMSYQNNGGDTSSKPTDPESGLEMVEDGSVGGSEEDDDDEVDDIPEDLVELSPEQQQAQIKSRAFIMMLIGTVICFVVSDPMVDVFTELARRLDVSSFFVTFLLAPLASNATELIAAYNYAKKKTTKSITISLSTLLGAACLNNTFSLGIFLFIIWWKSIVLDYFAEFSAIVFVQCVLWYMCQTRKVYSLLDGYFVLALFPLSLGVVSLLQAYGWK